MLEIINQKYMNLLIEVSKKSRNISELAKAGDLTVSVASTLISRWAREGVVIKQASNHERGGREIVIILTEYGKAQTELLKKLFYNHRKNRESSLTTKETDGGGVK